jgi:hypothetical protein
MRCDDRRVIADPILRGIGDVAVSSTTLDWQVAAIHAALRGSTQVEETFAQPGSKVRKQILEMLDTGTVDPELAETVRARIATATELATARDRVVHGYIWLENGWSKGVMSRHVRSNVEQELTEELLFDLARRLGGWVMGSGPTLVRILLATNAVPPAEAAELTEWLRNTGES